MFTGLPRAWAKMFEQRCAAAGLDPVDVLAALEHDFDDDDAFWAACEANVRAGRMRLVFAADSIRDELQLIVEFLNERMTPTEVLAMEVVRYGSADGQELLQARAVGQTEEAARVKGEGTRRRDVLAVLMEDPAQPLQPGTDLWLLPSWIPQGSRPSDPADPRLCVRF